MLPSLTPSQTSSVRTRVKYSAASAALRISGSDTISMSGVPARLKSMWVLRAESPKPSCSDFPASSSMCTRVMPMRRVSSPTVMSRLPPVASGCSYCEIW